MRSPIMALLWEQWRSTRWMYTSTLLVMIPMVALMSLTIDHKSEGSATLVCLLIPLSISSMQESSEKKGQHFRCSTHQWTLPINRRFFVAFYLGYRILAIAVIGLLAGLVSEVLKQTPHLYNVTVTIIMAIIMQAVYIAVFWTLEKRLILPHFLVALGCVFFGLCLYFFGLKQLFNTPWEWGFATAVFLAFCFTAAIRSALTFDTSTESSSFRWPCFGERHNDSLPALKSGYAAQCWVEWLQHGMYMVRGVYVGTFLVLLCLYGVNLVHFHTHGISYALPFSPVNALGCVAFFTLFPSALFTAIGSISEGTRSPITTQKYLFTLPLATHDIVMVRLVTTLKGTLAAFSVVIACFGVACLIQWATGPHTRFWPIYAFIYPQTHAELLIPSVLAGSFLLLWSFYCSPLFFILVLPFIGVLPIAISPLRASGILSSNLTSCVYLSYPFLMFVGSALYFGWRAWTQNLLSRKAILFFAFLIPVTMLAVAFVWQEVTSGTQDKMIFSILCGVILGSIPAASAFSHASWVQLQRHGR